jgi:penicillin-binding protein 1C
LKIVSITNGETIRRAGSVGGAVPSLRLEARGGQQELIWLVDGQQIGRAPAGKALRHAFPEAGRHAVTVMDESGRYDRVEISVR